MYICNDCGEIFDEPATEYEYHPYGMGYAREEWAVCPCCSSTCFEEARVCENCGEVITDDYEFGENDEYLCPDCYEELYGE